MATLTFGQRMKAATDLRVEHTIRLYFLCSLIFFALVFNACKQKRTEIMLRWDNGKAIALLIPRDLLPGKADTLASQLSVRLDKSDSISVLGEYIPQEDGIVFNPVVPLTPGLAYEVFLNKKFIGKIQVPMPDPADAPYVLDVFPGADTIPENQLKFYLAFSAPMREGESHKNIFLLDEKQDTLQDVFLDLQPELWNDKGTVLTLWLDPGRIKRDLIPNREMGNPLQKGRRYTLIVSEQWKDTRGLQLTSRFIKNFTAAGRDSLSPQPGSWKTAPVAAHSLQPLIIDFGEALDHFLVQECIGVEDAGHNSVKGEIRNLDGDRGVRFIPADKWKPGKYFVRVQSALEDLAGNNLGRLFDRDMRTQKPDTGQPVYELVFLVK